MAAPESPFSTMMWGTVKEQLRRLGLNSQREGWWLILTQLYAKPGEDLSDTIHSAIRLTEKADRRVKRCDELVTQILATAAAQAEARGGPLTIEQEAWLRGALVSPPSRPGLAKTAGRRGRPRTANRAKGGA